jgi:hypothetical protein
MTDKIPTLHVGTKRILATPMNRATWCQYRGWSLPTDENGDDPGFMVEYIDGGAPNIPGHAGYVSWSPADVFEREYAPDGKMGFGGALKLLEAGFRVSRSGWNGKGMWLVLADGGHTYFPDDSRWPMLPHILMKTVDDAVVPWLASQTDMLAKDWGLTS